MTNITKENHHRNSEFSHEKWWFPIVMLNYQRVYFDWFWWFFWIFCYWVRAHRKNLSRSEKLCNRFKLEKRGRQTSRIFVNASKAWPKGWDKKLSSLDTLHAIVSKCFHWVQDFRSILASWKPAVAVLILLVDEGWWRFSSTLDGCLYIHIHCVYIYIDRDIHVKKYWSHLTSQHNPSPNHHFWLISACFQVRSPVLVGEFSHFHGYKLFQHPVLTHPQMGLSQHGRDPGMPLKISIGSDDINLSLEPSSGSMVQCQSNRDLELPIFRTQKSQCWDSSSHFPHVSNIFGQIHYNSQTHIVIYSNI